MAQTPEHHLLEPVETFARSVYTDNDPAHDVLHVERVLATALNICDAEEAAGTRPDRTVLRIACWLHDIVQLPKGSGAPGEAARQSAIVARDLLRSLGAETSMICAVEHAVIAHSYSGGQEPESIEAAILQDADRIDALGAIGIARLWIIAGQLNTALYSACDPAATTRHLDDRRYALDHIPTKLLELPATLNTRVGREIADARLATTALFYENFLDELGMPD